MEKTKKIRSFRCEFKFPNHLDMVGVRDMQEHLYYEQTCFYVAIYVISEYP